MDLPERLPAPLSARLAGAAGAIYARYGREVDVAVGGLPFRLATTSELPQTIETIGVRKDQFDTEADPGEQSLSGWWRRSQSSFHEGAGFVYQESNDSNAPHNGFFDSSGVDPFVEGRLTLLKRMDETGTLGATLSLGRLKTYYDGATKVSAVGGGKLYTASSPTADFAALHSPASKTIVDGVVSGTAFYDVASDGTLYEGTVASPGTATTWPCGTTPARLGWGKHRLWMIGGRKLWQPDLSLAGGVAQDPVFTHPNLGWTYTCMAEGPGAMFFGGHDGLTSSIQAVTLEAGGGLPTLSGATVTSVLPEGELVQEIAVLAGQYVGIGTNRGFRVGTVGSNNEIVYGPLLIEPEGVTSCSAVTSQGRFLVVAFATADNEAVAYRVDTGTQLAEGVFPYAKDVECDYAGSITSLASIGDRVLATTSDGRPWNQSLTEYVASGWLQTGRVRYRTAEPKVFKYLNVEIQPLEGAIACDLILEGGSSLPVGSITAQGDVFDETLGIQLAPMKYASVRFTLTPGDDGAPVVNSYLLRSLPAVKPQRLITLPLLCFDQEQARSGQRYGATGYAHDRLTALHLLEDASEILVFQDFANAGREGRLVTIESVRYTQTAPAPPHGKEGAGGIILIQLRTVDA